MVTVPPYSLSPVMKLCPAAARVATALNTAACPEARATAAVPPWMAASRFSNTSVVGF